MRVAISTLRVVLNDAIEDGLMANNPAHKLGRFVKTEKPKQESTALTSGEVQRLLEAAKDHCPDYYPLFLTAVRVRLRRGELVALKWGDIGAASRTLTAISWFGAVSITDGRASSRHPRTRSRVVWT